MVITMDMDNERLRYTDFKLTGGLEKIIDLLYTGLYDRMIGGAVLTLCNLIHIL